jgi:hypothetical protein
MLVESGCNDRHSLRRSATDPRTSFRYPYLANLAAIRENLAAQQLTTAARAFLHVAVQMVITTGRHAAVSAVLTASIPNQCFQRKTIGELIGMCDTGQR